MLLILATYFTYYFILLFSRSVMPNSLQPNGLQQPRLPCPSPSPRVCSKSIESVMPSNHFVLCCPLLLLPSIFPSIRVFFNFISIHLLSSPFYRWGNWGRKWLTCLRLQLRNGRARARTRTWTKTISFQRCAVITRLQYTTLNHVNSNQGM